MWKPIKLSGLFIKMSKTGKVLKCSVADIDALTEDMKTKLTKRPTWKQNYSDKEREFMITLKGAIGEIWEDNEVPEEPKPLDEDEF
jgi:hypothetical protein